ncbi:MAG: ATP-dependent DNA helicase [bacterium]|nr:ATP-dependent DNA helicase [bacterium]MCM1375434.1 ATP-dependent DNA helicase [Muribaculum sp.]
MANRQEAANQEIMEEVHISVRELVEFLLRSGDIDNRHHASPDQAMQEGSRIHRMIQRRMGSEYQAEVSLRYTHPTEEYRLVLEGRADGIIDRPEGVTIDEIKGTYRELAYMKEPVPAHLAQAKCYAAMFLHRYPDRELQEIHVQMTYCHMETEEIRYFTYSFTLREIQEWFGGLIRSYLKWADYQFQWKQRRDVSIRTLEFPFTYRDGQKELVTYVYQTIYHQKKLFLEAPTGVGKTIATVFPAVKAMERGMGDKLFYLTAKTITRTVAENTFSLLRERGLNFKSVILTAKEKTCFMEETECNPEYCPYARGHYDRINDAIYDLLTHEESFCRETVEAYAEKHQVCPFEMCLDMSLFADGIICDYNYLFDPHVYLKRFFAGETRGNYLFLIDEAHNLLERGREMYSAALVKEDILALKNALQKLQEREGGKRRRRKLVALDREGETVVGEETERDEVKPSDESLVTDENAPDKGQGGSASSRGQRSVLVSRGFAARLIRQLENCNKEMLALKRECESCRIVEQIDSLMGLLLHLQSTVEAYLEEQEETEVPEREELLDFYFNLAHFLEIYELVNEKYVKYTQLREDGSFLLKLFCVDPSDNLKECMKRGRSAILFSATFLPIQYYKGLLGGEESDYEVYASSVFNPEKRALFIAEDVTSKYTRRSDAEFYNIARYIDEIVKNRHGNYMVFCPSYAFMHEIYDRYVEHFADAQRECILQTDYMSEADREAFLARFEGNEDCDLESSICMDIEMEEEKILIGFCVLGGIFSEGIDLKDDSLIGAIIVGTGLPQVCYERELLKQYFDGNGQSGFDYAYRYPGMNKVLQAAGRVIRTADDIGIVALLDERFLQFAYLRMFPREWAGYERVNSDNIARRVERFWDSWL